jgi:SAM-dependent methyltransferase
MLCFRSVVLLSGNKLEVWSSTRRKKMIRQAYLFARLGLAGTFVAAIIFTGSLVLAQAGEDYTPAIGQPGKDVIWVPTPEELVDRMLRMAQVTAEDYVVDLGSGDGVITIAAARDFKARALGIEYNPDMVELARRNAQRAGVADRATFIHGDIFEEDFSSATVVTMYLLQQLNLRLRDTLLQMKPGTRLVSHAFDMDDWEPDDTATVEGRIAFLWIVPAQVDGIWRLNFSQGGRSVTATMVLEQEFQKFSGTLSQQGVVTQLDETRLSGNVIEFVHGDSQGHQRRFSGTVDGNRMQGTVSDSAGQTVEFHAERQSAGSSSHSRY